MFSFVTNLSHLFGSGIFEEFDNWPYGVSPDNGIVDEDHFFALDVFRKSAEFLGDAELPEPCARLDERSADVSVFAQYFGEWNFRLKDKIFFY